MNHIKTLRDALKDCKGDEAWSEDRERNAMIDRVLLATKGMEADPVGAVDKPYGWTDGSSSDGCSTLFFNIAAVQKECDEHNAYWREQPDFTEEDLRKPEPLYRTALAARVPGKPEGVGEAVHQWRLKRKGAAWFDSTYAEAYSRVDENYEGRTLYTHPAPVGDVGLPVQVSIDTPKETK